MIILELAAHGDLSSLLSHMATEKSLADLFITQVRFERPPGLRDVIRGQWDVASAAIENTHSN